MWISVIFAHRKKYVTEIHETVAALCWLKAQYQIEI